MNKGFFKSFGCLVGTIGGFVEVTATGISSADMIVKTQGAPLLWANGDALQFIQNVTSYVNFGNIYPSQAKFWVSLWIKPSQNYIAGTTGWFFAKYNNINDRIELYYLDSGKILLRHKVGATDVSLQTAAINLTSGTWYHIVVSINQSVGGGAPSNGARVRVNNGVAVTVADAGTMPTAGNTYLGWRNTLAASETFNGIIANVIVGTDDLTNAEETALYAGTAPVDATDIWYLDEGTGNTIYSYGTSPNNGTKAAATTWGTTSRPEKLAISIGGMVVDSFARAYSVVDTGGGSWIIDQNNVMPYFDYYKHTVGTTEVVKYQPAVMLTGTTLPDLDVGDGVQNGTITWGSNTNITITYGEMVSSVSSNASLSEELGFTVPAAPMPAEWFSTTSNMANLPFYDNVSALSTQTGIPKQTFYIVFMFGLAVAGLLVAFMATRSMLIALITFDGILIVGSAQTIVPVWMVFVSSLLVVGILYLHNRVQTAG